MQEVDESNFKEQTGIGKVFVDFYSTTCGPCKIMLAVLEELSAEYDGIKFVKANTDKNKEAVIRYGVRSVPSFVLLDNGVVVGIKNGACQKGILKSFIQKLEEA